MPPEDTKGLPFLTREMLDFKHALRISVQIKTQSSAATTLIVSGITKSGKFLFNHITTSDGVLKTESFSLTDIPILISVRDTATTTKQGQTFARLALLLDTDSIINLASGYVYTNRGIGWPMTNNDEARLGGGLLLDDVGSSPAAGAEVNITVPSGRTWRLKSLWVSLTTDATVISRRVHIHIDKTGFDLYRFFTSVDQTASTTKEYLAESVGTIPDPEDNNIIIIPITQDILIPGNSHIRTKTTNIQAGDQFDQPNYLVEEFMGN